MICASSRKDSGDMVPGLRVFTATLVLPFHVPDRNHTAESQCNCTKLLEEQYATKWLSCTPKKDQPPRSCKIHLQLKQPLSHKYTDGEYTMNELCPFIALFICIHFLYCFSTLKLIMQINTNLCWMQFVKSVLDCMASYAILSVTFCIYRYFYFATKFFFVIYIILVICGCFSAGYSREFQQTEKNNFVKSTELESACL